MIKKSQFHATESGVKLGDALFSTAASTLIFGTVSAVTCLGTRFFDFPVTVIVIVIWAVFSAGLALGAVMRYKQGKFIRAWIVTLVCAAAGLAFGCWMGDLRWHGFGMKYYQYNMMASYTNVDPMKDKGASYMDAGTIYFKEYAVPAVAYAVGFQNGQRFCAAPILRKRHDRLGRAWDLPQTGAVDFWAVGINCCGASGENFTCGEADNRHARAGMRVLDASERDGYLLAVQQWSSKASVPVRHPLFFYWVRDPLEFREDIHSTAWRDFQKSVTIWAFVIFAVSLGMHWLLGKVFRIY